MTIRQWVGWPGAPLAIAAAVLFGASTPIAKALLGSGLSPWMLAGLLYLGSGLGLLAIWIAGRLGRVSTREAPLAGRDWGWMALIVLAGGVAGPVLLMEGLLSTPASSAALLLNVESLATMAIAWLAFRENVDRRLLLGAAAILAGAILLSWEGDRAAMSWGALAIVGACVAWGIDNNLTRKISGSDPVQIAMVKGLVAGTVNLAIGIVLGTSRPTWTVAATAGFVGFLGYGVSLTCFVLALRSLGTARTGAYFSTAPFIGAIVALGLFDEPITARLLLAGALMALGLWLHLTESHEHEHVHEPLAHSHAHVHDEHHQHAHGPEDPPNEPHVHAHQHEALRHKHPHYPDLHHRHGHSH